jgi:hypothetical protein
MKITKSSVLYNVIINLPVCFALSLFGALVNSLTIDWANFAINYAVSFVLAMAIGLFIPLTAIGRWFTGLFGIDNRTYTHNIRYRLLASLISSLIFYLIISPTLTVMNYFLLGGTSVQETVYHWLVNFPFLFLVGYTSTLISDLPAYRAAHKVDPNF